MKRSTFLQSVLAIILAPFGVKAIAKSKCIPTYLSKDTVLLYYSERDMKNGSEKVIFDSLINDAIHSTQEGDYLMEKHFDQMNFQTKTWEDLSGNNNHLST
jgi:hypothetical protein